MKRYLFLLSLLVILLSSGLFSQYYSINGTITHKGNALDSVLVTLSGGMYNSFITKANGYYSFLVPEGGDYTITPFKSGYTFNPTSAGVYNIQAPETRDFTTLIPNDSIRGVVTLKGSPLSGVTLSITGDTTLTDTSRANGSFSFLVQREGNYTITPSKDGFIFSPATRTFNEIFGTRVQNFEALDSAYLVTGKVTYENNPLADVDINYSGTKSGKVTTDTAGNYIFDVLLNSAIFIDDSVLNKNSLFEIRLIVGSIKSSSSSPEPLVMKPSILLKSGNLNT